MWRTKKSADPEPGARLDGEAERLPQGCSTQGNPGPDFPEDRSTTSVARLLPRRAPRWRELNRPIRCSLLFLKVPHESLRVVATLVEQLLAMTVQLFDNGIIDHEKSPSSSSGVHTNGMLKPVSSTNAVTRGSNSALAMWEQFQVSKYSTAWTDATAMWRASGNALAGRRWAFTMDPASSNTSDVIPMRGMPSSASSRLAAASASPRAASSRTSSDVRSSKSARRCDHQRVVMSWCAAVMMFVDGLAVR